MSLNWFWSSSMTSILYFIKKKFLQQTINYTVWSIVTIERMYIYKYENHLCFLKVQCPNKYCLYWQRQSYIWWCDEWIQCGYSVDTLFCSTSHVIVWDVDWIQSPGCCLCWRNVNIKVLGLGTWPGGWYHTTDTEHYTLLLLICSSVSYLGHN